ncbi:unnamed protein product [Ilex paraguariensis]
MNLRQTSGKEGGSDLVERVVIVAVKASKEISKTAMVWALTHVVQTGDCVKLLVVIPAHSSSKRLRGIPRFSTDCTAGRWRSFSGMILDEKEDITDSCAQMMLHLHDVYDPDKIKIKIKVVSGSQCGVVAAEGKRAQTHWVVLDKKMKKEAKVCMEQLECNVVVMKKSCPKVLRLNLVGSCKMEAEVLSVSEASVKHLENNCDLWNATQVPNVTPASSPEHASFTATDIGTSSMSSLDLGASPVFISGNIWDLKKEGFFYTRGIHNLDISESDTDSEKLSSPSTTSSSRQWITNILSSAGDFSKYSMEGSKTSNGQALNSTSEALWGKSLGLDPKPGNQVLDDRANFKLSKNVREMMSLTKNAPPDPPSLCSTCQHKAPVFGKPPRWFTYVELEHATGGFSQANFLAEGGYGSVYRGVLPDGQVIAVKQYKLASSQGDLEFCSEVEVLSCAQHRNVVMLIGFCVDDRRRLLVYEYICNGSLDSHLYGRSKDLLEWSARQKIAVGAARGLRYLHEECRVGCIVHRDMRPNNILLTHDFEPLVGDFGLARWQPDGDLGVETRIIGTFG